MDLRQDCESYVRNDDMGKGDKYVVISDSYGGKTVDRTVQQPAECMTNFNFGDRMVAVHFRVWTCEKNYEGPFLSIYDDCYGIRLNELVSYNIVGTN